MSNQFSVVCQVQHSVSRLKSASLPAIPVDDSSVHTWIPKATLEAISVKREKEMEFLTDQGERIVCSIGFVILRVGKCFTIDEVIFAERTDHQRLGLRSLQGLNLVADTLHQQLKPAPAKSAFSHNRAIFSV